MEKLLHWALGILFTMVIGAYGYANSTTSNVEDRVTKRIDRFEDSVNQKLDKLLERLR